MTKEVQAYFLDTLQKLVEIESVSCHEKRAAEFVAQKLEKMGYTPQLHLVGEDGANVTARIPGRGEAPALLVGGHIDTVAIQKGWEREPLRLTREDNRLYGLGASDMKGGIAALLAVLYCLTQNGERPAGDVLFFALADEEGMSSGAELFAGQGVQAEYCVLAEPHYWEMVVGATGKILLELTIRGKSGHAARPEEGVSAIEEMTTLLYHLDREWRAAYLQGTIGSHCVLRVWSDYEGYSLNIPECCRALVNKQMCPDEREEDVIRSIQERFAQCGLRGSLEIQRCRPHYLPYQADQNDPHLIRLTELAQKKTGKRPPWVINQSVSDGNIIQPRLGIQTVLFGPQGIGFHKPDEYLLLDTALEYIEIMYQFLTDCLA